MDSNILARAKAWLNAMPPSISGHGGHDAAMCVAGGLIQGFLLPRHQALDLLEGWNLRCDPPWSSHELEHKLDDAEAITPDKGWGYKLEDPKYALSEKKVHFADNKKPTIYLPRWNPTEYKLQEIADHGASVLGSLEDSSVDGIKGASPLELGDDFFSYLRLWGEDDVIWIGHVEDTGAEHKRAFFRTAANWAKVGIQGDRMLWTSGGVFAPGCYSRSKSTMIEHRYIIVESDRIAYSRQAAIFWFLKKELKLKIPMVVDTMGSSLHIWVDTRGLSPEFLANFATLMCGIHDGLENVDGKNRRKFRGGMGCDPATFRGSQPARLPGAIRPAELERGKRGGKQSIIWLDL